jgi:hypothetical protein
VPTKKLEGGGGGTRPTATHNEEEKMEEALTRACVTEENDGEGKASKGG